MARIWRSAFGIMSLAHSIASAISERVREALKYLRENKLTLLKMGAYDTQAFVNEENKLNASLIKLQDQEQTSNASKAETMKDVVRLSELDRLGGIRESIVTLEKLLKKR